MKFNGVDHYDVFAGEIVFWVAITDLPERIQDKARHADADSYNPGCFGICVSFDTDGKKFGVSPDNQGADIYYVKEDGDKIWFACELSAEFINEVFSACCKKLRKNGAKSCKLCGGAIVWEHPVVKGHYFESSCNLEDWPICHDCMAEHCCRTNCLGCEYGKHPDCRFLQMKRHYMSN